MVSLAENRIDYRHEEDIVRMKQFTRIDRRRKIPHRPGRGQGIVEVQKILREGEPLERHHDKVRRRGGCKEEQAGDPVLFIG